MSCEICVEPYAPPHRRPFRCPRCAQRACTACVQAHILCRRDPPSCPHCLGALGIEELAAGRLPVHFFRGALPGHLPTALVAGGRARARTAQPHARRVAEIGRAIDRARGECVAARAALRSAECAVDARRARRTLLLSTLRLRTARAELRQYLRTLRARPGVGGGAPGPGGPAIGACPRDRCRGAILPGGACAACGGSACPECLSALDGADDAGAAPHACPAEVLESARAVRADATACPGCGAPIHRSEGCRQMFCPLCATLFDYETGAVDRGRVHNAAALEALRAAGDESECGADEDAAAAVAAAERSDGLEARLGRERCAPRLPEGILRSAARAATRIRSEGVPRLRARAELEGAELDLLALYASGRVDDGRLGRGLASRALHASRSRAGARLLADLARSLEAAVDGYVSGRTSLARGADDALASVDRFRVTSDRLSAALGPLGARRYVDFR